MQLGPRTRRVLAWLLMPFGFAGACAWVGGQLLEQLGNRLWIWCHQVVRDPGCSCSDCELGS